MSLTINRGIIGGAVKACVYGIEGIGKTTFASKWPDAVFIDCEGGTKRYDVARMIDPRNWKMLLSEIKEASENPGDVGTLVIDTADAAEAICKAYILDRDNKDGIESYGYGKGYTVLAEEFRKMLDALDNCIEAGINALVLAHCQIKKFEQPDEAGAYDRYELKLEKKCSPLLKEWADLLLFANFKTDVMKDENNKVHASGGTKRVMYAQRRASYDAKNRFGLPASMPFDYAEIAHIFDAPKPEPKPEPKSEPKPEPKVEGMGILEGAKVEEVTPDNVRALHKLMERDSITTDMLAMAVGANPKNKYTAANCIADYSEKFVDSLVAHWDSVAGSARSYGLYANDDIPF